MTRTRLPALAFSALSFLACVAAAPAAMAAIDIRSTIHALPQA